MTTHKRRPFRRIIRAVGSTIVAIALTFSVYQALSAPSRESHDIRRSLDEQVIRLRSDNAILCRFFSITDSALGELTSIDTVSPAGAAIRAALAGVQAAARNVVTSPICPPPGPAPSPTATPSR